MNLFPLYLSLKVAFFATIIGIVLALPAAWHNINSSQSRARIIGSFANLPLVLPPTVLGYYLLVLVGRQSYFGQLYEKIFGHSLVFTWQGAVLAAGIVAFPLLFSSIRTAMASIDQDIINAARLLGHSELSIFVKVTLPLAWRGIMSGVALAFARAMGDFGATLMVAGNIPNKTQTMAIAVYDAMMAGNMAQANTLVLIMTLVAVSVLLIITRLEKKFHQGQVRIENKGE